MKFSNHFFISTIVCIMMTTLQSCKQTDKTMVEVYETSAQGNALKKIEPVTEVNNPVVIKINIEEKFQTITGFGGSFTEASAYLLNKLSKANRDTILKAYFSEEGANYSLTRTHINSCDFSLNNYAYAMKAGDTNLDSFSIEPDRADLIPMIKEAMQISKDGFKIIASPWTAPPWMKDNNDWRGGKLLPQYNNTWALYFSKYLEAYKREGINIWGVTVENEPLGNNNNWESMHYTPEEMTAFVKDYLGPQLEKSGHGEIKILGYDQNRGEELEHWANVMYKDEASSKYFDGMAVHWYASTYDFFPASLQHTYKLAPSKHIINTEACIDADVPHWKDDNWYWSKEATDWGWDWATEKDKYLHPKYVPVYRYAGDIIGCLNNHVDGWIDWNMVLNKQGGPNWFKNWCTAPVIVDEEKDEVYFTPLYYTMAHFSKFIRPGAVRIGFDNPDSTMMVTAAQNTDGSVIVVVFNPTETEKSFSISLKEHSVKATISAKAIQTIVIK
ncbi:MAG: glycoside hydrolase family 30 protein [Lacibacter sp.]|jgi:glucosylceramidase